MLSAHLPSHARVLEGPPPHPAPGWWGSLHQLPSPGKSPKQASAQAGPLR
jgi:hypothetical protein